jgi:hypothetical protein
VVEFPTAEAATIALEAHALTPIKIKDRRVRMNYAPSKMPQATNSGRETQSSGGRDEQTDRRRERESQTE